MVFSCSLFHVTRDFTGLPFAYLWHMPHSTFTLIYRALLAFLNLDHHTWKLESI